MIQIKQTNKVVDHQFLAHTVTLCRNFTNNSFTHQQGSLQLQDLLEYVLAFPLRNLWYKAFSSYVPEVLSYVHTCLRNHFCSMNRYNNSYSINHLNRWYHRACSWQWLYLLEQPSSLDSHMITFT